MINKKKKEVNYRPKKRFGTTLVPLVTLTVLVGALSAVVAGAWQLTDKVDYIPPVKAPQESSVAAAPSSSSQPGTRQGKETTSSASPASDSQSSSQSTVAPTGDAATYQVAESEWAGSEYFDDALFVGDSITDGIKIYDIMSNATVLSYTGINLDNIFTKQVIKDGTEGNQITIMEAAKAAKPGKIYVMMGANSMGYDQPTFVKEYGRLVDELHKMHPDAVLYVQSILPVTTTYEKNRPEFANSKIDEYNDGLRQMAKDKGYAFVNVAEAFKDEAGALPTEASPKDGMHFSAQWYRKWFDYLRQHVKT